MLHARGPRISQNLRDVFVRDRLGGLYLENQSIRDDQVDKMLSEDRAVLIHDRQRVLLPDAKSSLLESMKEGVVINLFEMAGAEIVMNFETRLSDDIA